MINLQLFITVVATSYFTLVIFSYTQAERFLVFYAALMFVLAVLDLILSRRGNRR